MTNPADDALTTEQKAVNFVTMRHIERVRLYLNRVISCCLRRAEEHDQTKLQVPEVEAFRKHTDGLSKLTYGSKEYTANLENDELKAALEHHYANNRHHPQHFKNGVDDMNLIDLVEMLCDWKASSERHNDGNIRKSIELNAEKYKISPQLRGILEHTADYLF